uniref:tRNA(Phe) (4-demethylwyosine(37)-C(7)) aminocarboxypropyltransferase n=1 Tax=Geospiza parvula TaxID=87175 RepID=A0A8C3NM15_GEOPR
AQLAQPPQLLLCVRSQPGGGPGGLHGLSGKAAAKHQSRQPEAAAEPPSLEVAKRCVCIWGHGGLGSAGGTVGLQGFRGLSQRYGFAVPRFQGRGARSAPSTGTRGGLRPLSPKADHGPNLRENVLQLFLRGLIRDVPHCGDRRCRRSAGGYRPRRRGGKPAGPPPAPARPCPFPLAGRGPAPRPHRTRSAGTDPRRGPAPTAPPSRRPRRFRSAPQPPPPLPLPLPPATARQRRFQKALRRETRHRRQRGGSAGTPRDPRTGRPRPRGSPGTGSLRAAPQPQGCRFRHRPRGTAPGEPNTARGPAGWRARRSPWLSPRVSPRWPQSRGSPSASGSALGETVAAALGARRVARRGRVMPDGMRSPRVTLLLGQHGWVEHVDNGIRYTFDVTKCMFSPGNITEKLRVASLPCSGEVVVDLYAGIGYFTLPFLVHAGAAFVHACEWNSHAVEALHRSLVLNGVRDRCHIHSGDSRQLQLRDVADRVNLGLIPSSEEGWPVACRVLKKATGGVLHIHHNVETRPALPQSAVLLAERGSAEAASPGGEAQHLAQHGGEETLGARLRPEWQSWAEGTAARIQGLLAQLHGRPWRSSVLHIEPVKSYAPHVHHLVLDLECRPVLPV